MGEALDRRFIAAAIRLGASGLGTTWPNPAVGAIVVRDGRVIGRGRTGRGGRPHGEPQALAMAGEAARGATLYVSLEPCSHFGKTPPCADAIVAAGIARVVVATTDPDPRVAGRGLERLRAAGIEVVEGVMAAEARRAQAGHFSRIRDARPHVMLKLAVSADDAIGRVGEAQVAVTAARARVHVQALRARFDAIMVGRGTVEADDPELTCRLPGLEDRSPVRVVLDSDGRLPSDHRVFQGIAPTWVFSADEGSQTESRGDVTSPSRGGRNRQAEGAADFGRGAGPLDSAPPSRNSRVSPQSGDASNFDLPSRGRLEGRAAPNIRATPESPVTEPRRFLVPRDQGGLDLAACLHRLSDEGITRVLLEGGAHLARRFLESGLVDAVMLFRSPEKLGGALVPALAGLPLSTIEAPGRFQRVERRRFGADMMSLDERAD